MSIQIHSRSTVDDISAVSFSALKAISGHNFSSDPYLTEQIQNLTNHGTLMTEALKEKKAQSILAPADLGRDNTVKIVFYEVKSKTLWVDEEVKNAALQIYDVLENYGIEVTRLPYHKQSAQVKAMFQDLKTAEILAAIALIPGLAQLIEQAEAEQEKFDTIYDEYLSAKTDNKNILPAGKLGEIMKDLINDELMSYLKVMARTQAGSYKACYDKVSIAIEENNSKVKARLNKIKKEAEQN